MHLGVMMFSTDETVGPARLATMVAERGFESMFLPEHSHIPLARTTPYPRGGELPREYHRTFDMFVALAAATTAAPGLTIGSGIAVVPQHDPIHLAKQAATLDHLSSGRFVLGMGFGWNRDEIEHHGVAYRERRDVARERMLAVRRLWTEDAASFDGEHVSFSASHLWPKPVQQPGPPVVLGGAAGPKLFQHIAEYGDGWAPIGARTIEDGLADLHRAFESAGRDPATLRLHAFDPRADERLVDHYATLGVERLVLTVPPLVEDDLARHLDGLVGLIDRVR